MVRSTEEIEEIIDVIMERVNREVMLKNRLDELDPLLVEWGLTQFVHTEIDEHYKHGTIVVLGESSVKTAELLGIAKSLGIDKGRFEFVDYNEAKTFNYRKMLNNLKYSVVLFGPIPHSTTGKGETSSAIVEIETSKGYPPTKRLMAGNALKITKFNFRQALEELIQAGQIKCDF